MISIFLAMSSLWWRFYIKERIFWYSCIITIHLVFLIWLHSLYDFWDMDLIHLVYVFASIWPSWHMVIHSLIWFSWLCGKVFDLSDGFLTTILWHYLRVHMPLPPFISRIFYDYFAMSHGLVPYSLYFEIFIAASNVFCLTLYVKPFLYKLGKQVHGIFPI